MEGVSPARLKRRKWKVESSEGKMTTREIIIRDRRTGEETVRTVTGYRYDKDNIFWTDAGFDYNPGAVALADNILRERIRGLNDPALYEQARQAINNSTARHEGFAAVVEGWQKDKVIRKRAAILGLMRWQELLHARAQGRMPAAWWSLPTTVCTMPGAASTRPRAPPYRMPSIRSWPPFFLPARGRLLGRGAREPALSIPRPGGRLVPHHARQCAGHGQKRNKKAGPP